MVEGEEVSAGISSLIFSENIWQEGKIHRDARRSLEKFFRTAIIVIISHVIL
jgi:hypothetical protein